jgi:hypothetical protein
MKICHDAVLSDKIESERVFLQHNKVGIMLLMFYNNVRKNLPAVSFLYIKRPVNETRTTPQPHWPKNGNDFLIPL